MESIESDIVQNDYDGLTTRDARRQFAKDCYETSKDAAEIRSLAQAALLKKVSERFLPNAHANSFLLGRGRSKNETEFCIAERENRKGAFYRSRIGNAFSGKKNRRSLTGMRF